MSRNAASAAARKALRERPSAAPERTTPVKLADDGAAPVASAVHDLQGLLALSLEAPDRKWPARATVGFVLLVCGGFWAGVFLAVRMLLG